ncbi:MAG TPA: ABC transporter permease [Burkholderiaceae bacterium]|nr:ABC transporter permease [Burkholderiaceae bacterium]
MIGFQLTRRARPSRAMQWLSPILAVALTLVVGLAVFAALGQAPARAFHAFFIEPVSDANGIAELLLKASPLCLIALGLAIGYRANVWNIGAEGQMYIGGAFATGLAITFQHDIGMALLPLMIIAGAIGGMAWAALTAFCRAQLKADEILVSLMLTYVANLVVKYLVYGPWQDPQANNFPLTVSFEDNALFPLLASLGWSWFDGTRLNLSIFLTLAAIPLAWFFVQRTFMGFKLEVGGLAPGAARYAGFSARGTVWVAMLIGGAAAGLAGVTEVAGPLGQLNDRWTPGYGFTAIIVAALGRLNPLGIPLAALLMALLYLGGEAAQITLQLPKAISLVFQGLLLMFLLGCEVLINFRVKRVARPAPAAAKT